MYLTLATAPNPGAIGLLQLHGTGVVSLLEKLSGVSDWPERRMRLVNLADIDEGLAVCLRHNWAQLMPHGGPRVMQLLVDRLVKWGATWQSCPSTWQQYPEAASRLEADMLATIAAATSPAAIDLLLAQPRLWRRWCEAAPGRRETSHQILARSIVFQHMVQPPAVIVAGRPNVGKSTLSNRMLGHSASIVADLPGTTRDWVEGLAQISPPCVSESRELKIDASRSKATSVAGDSPSPHESHGAANSSCHIAVRWLDTPGLRQSSDAIEQRAIALAQQVMVGAHVLVVMRDPKTDWPAKDVLPRRPHVWVMNKIDRLSAGGTFGDGTQARAPLGISASEGIGIHTLQQALLKALELDTITIAKLWAFSTTLRGVLSSPPPISLAEYV